MYGLIWRIMPGPWVSKLIMTIGLIVGVAALLWFVVFPEISPHMPFNDGAVGTAPGGGEVPAPGDEPGDGGD
ncbi:hypothetical protein [Nocardiopsis salina]|uniref:hypothetical protein n=1 Tax=Nocardiopsis salina TaxID=245836 RepID=UPI0003462F7C|nr:hypothetical protein [Nocardiopsis salina]